MNVLAQVKQKHQICTTARSKYESLGTELWSAWPVHSVHKYKVHTSVPCTPVHSAHKSTVTSAQCTQVHTQYPIHVCHSHPLAIIMIFINTAQYTSFSFSSFEYNIIWDWGSLAPKQSNWEWIGDKQKSKFEIQSKTERSPRVNWVARVWWVREFINSKAFCSRPRPCGV